MSWYYDDEGVGNYYKWYKQSKELERLRKIKKKKQALRRKQLAREKKRLEARLAREQAKEQAIQEKKEFKQKRLETLKTYGFKKGYMKLNALKPRKNQRDLKLCQELYEKNKSGISRFNLAIEYKMTPITVTRHIYEYEYYLRVKSAGQELKDLL